MRKIALATYGILVIASGIWRHIETGESPEALWFGIVMGALALFAAGLMFLRYVKTSYAIAVVPILFVGGWFVRRLFTHQTDGVSPRVIIVVAATVLLIFALIVPIKRRTKSAR